MIYLDYNASAPLRETAKRTINESLTHLGNPSSIHGSGRLARKSVEDARECIAKTLNIKPKRIVFTSGATESNNHIIKNYNGPVIFSKLEHDSILKSKPDAITCPTLQNGTIDLDYLEKILSTLQGQKPLVSLVSAHNETGIIQPLEEACAMIKQYGGYFHTDAAQALGRTTFPWDLFDFISLSSHKIGGLSGTGALVVHEQVALLPIITGGGQERSFRSGTENVLGIIAFGSIFQEAYHQDWTQIKLLRDNLEKELCAYSSQSMVIGKEMNRLPNTTLITMPKVKSVTQVMHFDLNNICVSAGSACSSGKVKTSTTLSAMNLPQDIQETTLRISLSPETTKAEIQIFINCWKNLFDKERLKIS